ncbi:MAG: hypothetical protein JOZ60_04660 [Verrucomicrobia bacterium]|nr:hypothetical protein [Verrucomicrobiota bacterium]
MKRWMELIMLLDLSVGCCFGGPIPWVSNDPDFVSVGKHRGYYMISSDSGKWWRWGLVRAPVEEPRMFTHGFGDDAIAIPFDVNGRVAFAPVYIYTIRPENDQRRRLEALVEGVSSQAEVRQIFGRPAIQGSLRGYPIWYYEIQVYNPFEEFPDIHG